MNLQNLRWPVVVAAMAVTLAALFGAGFMFKSRTVDEPLKTLYGNSPYVESYSVAQAETRREIKLKLKATPDLAAAYRSLDEATADILKGAPYTLKVEDRRNAKLEAAQRRVNLYVQEALATGQFTAMADRVEAEAVKAGVTARLSVDSERVYIELHDADGYLYDVVARQSEPEPRAKGGLGL